MLIFAEGFYCTRTPPSKTPPRAPKRTHPSKSRLEVFLLPAGRRSRIPDGGRAWVYHRDFKHQTTRPAPPHGTAVVRPRLVSVPSTPKPCGAAVGVVEPRFGRVARGAANTVHIINHNSLEPRCLVFLYLYEPDVGFQPKIDRPDEKSRNRTLRERARPNDRVAQTIARGEPTWPDHLSLNHRPRVPAM
jgi:hypothetical protein